MRASGPGTRNRDGRIGNVQRFLNTGAGPILNRRVEIEALRPDGTEIPIELTVTTAVSEGIIFTAFLRDVTDKRRADAERKPLGTTRWQVSTFWIFDRQVGRLRAEAVWTRSPDVAPEFVAAALARTVHRGTGLPGRVWERGGPAWVAGVTLDDNFPRGRSPGTKGSAVRWAFQSCPETSS